MSDSRLKTMGEKLGRRSWAEPWKIKMVEPLRMSDREHRERALKEAGYNTFLLKLLNNWNPATGLVRDKAKDASGEFDAIQATGSLAAATALAQQLGVIERPAANRIVAQISQALLVEVPRYRGLWPHWVKTSQTGEITIVPDTEWSSVDTAIAAIGLLDAQSGLGLDTYATEQLLQSIDWSSLVTPTGISHGFTYSGDLIPYAWDVFGGESWLVELAYAGVTGQVAPMAYPSPPTANGSGFIDELAWLYVSPPSGQDYWGTDWTSSCGRSCIPSVRGGWLVYCGAVILTG